MPTISYKGYLATIELNLGAGVIRGRVAGLAQPLTFEVNAVNDLEPALARAVERYLVQCRVSGQEPEKQYSGKMLVRMPPEMHRKLAMAATGISVSINEYLIRIIDRALARRFHYWARPGGPPRSMDRVR